MSSFWIRSNKLVAHHGRTMARPPCDIVDPREQSPDFPLDIKRTTNLVRARHETLCQPTDYFAALARRMHSVLPGTTWLANLRSMHFAADSENSRLATWIYAKHYRTDDDGSVDATLAHRDAILQSLHEEYLSIPAIVAAERALTEIGSGPSQALLLPWRDAQLLLKGLECSAASSTPRWLAFSSAKLASDGALPILDAVLQLRSILDEAGSATADSLIGRASEELVRRTAAAWLADHAPSLLLLAGKPKTALYDAILLHDSRLRVEEVVPPSRTTRTPEWLDRDAVHARLERQVGTVIDLARDRLSSAALDRSREGAAAGSCGSARATTDASSEAERADPASRGLTETSSLDQIAFFEALSAIMWNQPSSISLSDALRFSDPIEAGAGSASPGVAGAGGIQSHRLRAIGLVGAALRLAEIRSRFTEASEPATEATSYAGNPVPASDDRSTQPGRVAEESREPRADALGAPDVPTAHPIEHACMPLGGLLQFVKWLSTDSTGSDSIAAQNQALIGRMPRVPGVGFIPTGYRMPKPRDAAATPRSFRPAELSVARGLRFISGEHRQLVDACIDVIQHGVPSALPRIGALPPDQYALLLRHLPLPESSADQIRLGLLRSDGAKAVELMPEFAQLDQTPNPWLALWMRVNPGHPQPYRSNSARKVLEFTESEIAQLPDGARRGYLLGYILRFGEDAARHIPANDSELQTPGRPPRDDAAETELGSYLTHVARAVHDLPPRLVKQHIPLRALAAALPQETFDRLDVSDLEVAELFGYGGPKARVVWTHAWRRLAKRAQLPELRTQSPGTQNPGTSDPAPAEQHPAAAAVLRAIERGRFTLRNLRLRSPESSSGGEHGDVARLMVADPAIAEQLRRQIASADDIAFLSRVGGAAMIGALDDAEIAQLVHSASGKSDAYELEQLLLDSARRNQSPLASGERNPELKITGTITDGDEIYRLKTDRAALVAVHHHVGLIAERVCGGHGPDMLAAPLPDSSRRCVPGQPAGSIRLPVPQQSRPRALVAASLLRIIGLSSGRCELPLELVQRLVRVSAGPKAGPALGRPAADLMRGAAIGRKRQRREMTACGKSVDHAISIALELAHQGLADEFPQLVDACLADSLDARYVTHRIQKKRGGVREINEPDPDLKRLQRKILSRFLSSIPLSRNAHGFIPGRGARTNAAVHARQRIVLNVDIRNFFGSLPISSVRAAIAQTRRGALSDGAIDLLVKIVTRAGALPQGAPTSPTITNIALRHADGILNKAARRVRVRYTRYADDLTFSGRDGPVQRIVPLVRDVLRPLGLELHPDKTHVYRSGRRQLVTGLVVNDRPNLPRRDRRKLRAAAHSLSNGLAMHWNGVQMDRASFAGRLAYLTTVNRPEADRLRTKAGIPLPESSLNAERDEASTVVKRSSASASKRVRAAAGTSSKRTSSKRTSSKRTQTSKKATGANRTSKSSGPSNSKPSSASAPKRAPRKKPAAKHASNPTAPQPKAPPHDSGNTP